MYFINTIEQSSFSEWRTHTVYSCYPYSKVGVLAGSVYALLHSVQSVVVFLGPLAHNAVFAVTLHFMSGLVFLLSGPILVVPIIFLL